MMYARRYPTPQEEKNERVRVPENYVGNAFRDEPQPEEEIDKKPEEREEKEAEKEAAKPFEDEKRNQSALLPFIHSKFLSSDVLLILLAFLLMGNGDGDDLPGILIFLMLL